jgi:hypothetical protein
MKYEWGPWIEHDGKSIGAPKGAFIEADVHYPEWGKVTRRRGQIKNLWAWTNVHPIFGPECIRYRVRRPLVSEWLAETTSDLPVTEEA